MYNNYKRIENYFDNQLFKIFLGLTTIGVSTL